MTLGDYTRVNFVDEVTPLDQANMNNMDAKIDELDTAVDTAVDDINTAEADIIAVENRATAIENDIDYPTTVKQKALVDTGEDGGVEGGIFNGDFEYGDGTTLNADLQYGWCEYYNDMSADSEIVDGCLKITTGGVGTTFAVGNTYGGTPTWVELTRNGIEIKPSTNYRLTAIIRNTKADGFQANVRCYDSALTAQGNFYTTTVSSIDKISTVVYNFTSPSVETKARLGLIAKAQNDILEIFDVKLEQIDTQTVNTQVATPASVSITGVTTTDNVDQSQTSEDAATSISGGLVYSAGQQFTPDESKLSAIVLKKSDGTATGNITFSIETDSSDVPSGTILASHLMTAAEWNAVSNAAEFTIDLPCILDVGTKYWITTTNSVQADVLNVRSYNTSDIYAGGLNKYKDSGSTWNTLARDLYFKTHFAKHTESPIIEANGAKLDLTGTKLLTGATITVNKDGSGEYRWYRPLASGDAEIKCHDAHSLPTSGTLRRYTDGTLRTDINGDIIEYKIVSPFVMENVRIPVKFLSGGASNPLDFDYSLDGVNWTTLGTLASANSTFEDEFNLDINSDTIYLRFHIRNGSVALFVKYIGVYGSISDLNMSLPLMVPSSEVQSETLDLVQNPIDISEGQFLKLKNDLTGWGSRTITILASEALFESQAVSASTIYVYDSNGTGAWAWDERNGLVPPADRTSGTVMVKYIVGDNQIKSSVNGGSMKGNFNLSWDEESLRAAINRLTEIANLMYPIVVEVEDVPEIDLQSAPIGTASPTGYGNDVYNLNQVTAGVAAIAYTGLLPRENRFSEWLDIVVECDDGDGVLQGKLYTADGVLIETYADLEANPVLTISNPDYKYSRERLVLQISASTETTSTAWSVTKITWRYQYEG